MKRAFAAIFIWTVLMTVSAVAADFRPGQDIEIDRTDSVWGDTFPDEELTTANYAISSQSWTSGKDLVSSVWIDNDNGVIVISLKDDYKTTKEKTLKGTVKVRDRSNNKTLSLGINCTVGWEQATIDIDHDGDISTLTVDEDSIYTVEAASNSIPYGQLEFYADIADISVRVYDKEVFYLGYNREPDKNILRVNEHVTEDIEFLNFPGKPSFSGTATVSFYGFGDKAYVYEAKNGKLSRISTTWDSNSDSILLKTKTLTNYVISSEPLRSSTGTTADIGQNNGTNNGNNNYNPDLDINPDTGDHSVPGLAIGLAIAALVSAAAVSLKKD